MIHKAKLVLLLFILIVAQSKVSFYHSKSVQSQYVPIFKRYPGIDLPGTNPSVTLEVVYDSVCKIASIKGGESALFDTKLRQVQSALQKSNPGKFSYRFSFQVLPYHISSFKMTQAIKYVNDKQGPNAAIKTMRHFFDTNLNWVEAALVKANIADLMSKISRQVSGLTGLAAEEIRTQIAHYSATDYETRKWVKYAMGTLHVSGTPTVFVNGARLDGAFDMTSQQLIDLLTGLL